MLYFFHMNEELDITDEVPIESVSLIMVNFSVRIQLNLIKPILLVVNLSSEIDCRLHHGAMHPF